jgi:hypothetical protein|tara:strand:- start:656 stop:1399 length:744 start_codon:yes stop_codon:yes gene_type:complete
MVNIDTVYQKVLAIANKEQRGYITPQEFNLFADYAQKDIFEKYFYDLNQFKRIPGNSTGYSDMINNLEEKISLFEIYNDNAVVVGNNGDINISNDFPNIYRLTVVRVNYKTRPRASVAEEIQLRELDLYRESPLARWSKKHPVYTRYSTNNNADRLKIYPYPSNNFNIDQVKISYIKKPNKPNWSGIEVNGNFLYNEDASTNFELHPEEENLLIVKILQLAGIAMKDFGLAQAAGQKEVNDNSNEKA